MNIIMFPEIEGGTQMQLKRIYSSLHGEKCLRTPGLQDQDQIEKDKILAYKKEHMMMRQRHDLQQMKERQQRNKYQNFHVRTVVFFVCFNFSILFVLTMHTLGFPPRGE